jgi:MFS family permease
MSRQDSQGGSLRAAWPLLVAGFVIEFVVIGGGIDTVGVFLNALTTANQWSHLALSAGISVGTVSAALSTPAVGILIDRYGVRVPMALGLVVLALGFGALLFMTEPWHFAAANVLLGAGFAGCTILPITVAVTMSVPERTALALGLVATGSSLGALVLAPLLQIVVEAWTWRGAYLALGTAVVLVPVPLILFALPRGRLRRPHEQPSDGAPNGRLHIGRELRRPGVLPLAALFILPGVFSWGVQVHLVPYLSAIGYPNRIAAGALGAAVGISAIGKVAGGFIGDRIGALTTLRAALLLELGALWLLSLAIAPLMLGGFVVVHGLAIGTQVAVFPVIALAILGTERFATLYGLLQLGGTLAIGLAPILPGIIFDATGRYTGAVVLWFAVTVLAVGTAFWLRIPPSARSAKTGD